VLEAWRAPALYLREVPSPGEGALAGGAVAMTTRLRPGSSRGARHLCRVLTNVGPVVLALSAQLLGQESTNEEVAAFWRPLRGP